MTNPIWSRHLRHAVIAVLIAGVFVGVTPSSSVATAPPALTISGSIDGLYPGFTGQLFIHVRNPFDHAIRLTTLTTTAQHSAAGCEHHLVIGDVIGQPTVPALAEISLAVPVSFDRAAPDTCQGVSMPLAFTVKADETDSDRPNGGLPHAGSDTNGHVELAATTFAFGAGIVLLARRRQR